ncbi:monocarboxylate transporter 14-like [Saccostrea echinata]|uniref:monocarboxylate transporter 14-like n=1 Tax=Saccostrea echinata TaxID=191078 RepID=UPI002A827590|nr:monocarboxylate transporter 14-like [Saccostrea echinata]XP_061169914.1 monocarboxylate transporter 14-like [Saccostrea echinata]XP_061169915.1 monocarboxylate transporter 14-like [Saccostrea echinata]XP_061169916.1 monocarboxylate transporter 14-like [Saccostrea echinata]
MSNEKKRHESGESYDSTDSVGDLIPTPPDGGWGWVIVFSSLLCNIIVDGIGYAFGVLLPQWEEVFHESPGKISLVGSLLVGVYLCAGPLVSGLTNKFGCRPVTFAGSCLACLGFLLASFSSSINVLMLTYGIMGGLGFGLIYLPAIVSVGFYFEKKRAIATGIAVSGSGIGTFIFAPANAAMLEAYDWKFMLVIHAGIILNGCVCAMVMRPLDPPKRKKRKPKIRAKTMIDRVKERAIANRNRAGESESSVQIGESFAKLQEAKRLREERLKEEGSDILSMPSAYFEKTNKLSFSEAGESYCGSPVVDIPKITFSGIDGKEIPSPESPRSENFDAKSGSKEAVQRKSREEETTKKEVSDANILKGVYSHEVEPLIENGYAKVAPRQAKDYSSAARLRMGSQHNIEKKDYARPMYRQDIFYSGSVNRIPQFTSQPDMHSYITSITTIPGEIEIPPSSVWDHCTCLPKSIVDTLRDMLDFSILKNVSFVLICVGNLFAMVGFYVPFTYLVDHALEQNVSKTDAAFLLSVIGITNTVGRILSGVLADLTKVDALIINNVALVISAVLLFLEPLCTTYPLLILFAALYGLCVSAYISLTSIIICDIIGLEKLTNAFGMLTLARGTSSIYGPPLAGALRAATDSYNYSFYLGGGMFTVGAIFHLMLHLPCIKRKGLQELTGADLDVPEAEAPVAV